MLEKVQELLREVESFSPKKTEELEIFRIRFLGKKGVMNDLFAAFKTVPNEQKKDFGQALNQLKQAAQNKLVECNDVFEDADDDGETEGDDEERRGEERRGDERRGEEMIGEERRNAMR